jgi:hypothetical protein
MDLEAEMVPATTTLAFISELLISSWTGQPADGSEQQTTGAYTHER